MLLRFLFVTLFDNDNYCSACFLLVGLLGCSSLLYVLVRLNQHVLSAADTGSFLSVAFGSSLVQMKRAFDRFFQTHLRSIEDAKQPRGSKCGVNVISINCDSNGYHVLNEARPVNAFLNVMKQLGLNIY